MPTGYTDSIKDGITFQEFALNCMRLLINRARAFGALVTMRDEPSDTPIPDEFKPTDYHENRLAEIKDKLAQVEALSVDDCAAEAEKEYKDRLKYLRESITAALVLKSKYSDMLTKVKAWPLPSSNHKGLKDFMIQQIESSMEFDCSVGYYEQELSKLRLLLGREWQHITITQLMREKVYHEDEHMKEISRIAGRNTWVRQLRESLK